MIKFTGKNVDVDALKYTVKDALISCAAEAIAPLYGDYKRTPFDYSSCKTEQEKRLVFAESFLGEIDIETIDDGVILHDDLNVEGAQCAADYDLGRFIRNVQMAFPNLDISGMGEIDYHFAVTEYEIITENKTVKIVYDGGEGLSEGDDDESNSGIPDDFMGVFGALVEVFVEAEDYEYELAEEGVLPDAPLPDASISSLENFPRIVLKANEGDKKAIAIIEKIKESNEIGD